MMGKIFVLPNVDYRRDLNKKIVQAENFTYGEFVSSETAVRMGYKNVPTEEEWQKVEALARDILQPLRNKLGRININSGYRCKALNDHICSSDASYHRTGGGVDLDPEECTLMQLCEEAMKMNVSEVIAEYFPDGWVHIGYLRGKATKTLKLKDANHHYSRISMNDLRGIYHA
jgi:zinc D-Ala-D-Ala carboxypeptidase